MLVTVWILISYLTAHSAAKPISLDNGSVADETAHDRQKRWNILRNTYYSRTWPTNRPITLSVLNSPEGCSRQDVEDILLECARMWGLPSSVYFQLAAENTRGNIDVIFKKMDGIGNYRAYTTAPHPGFSVPMFLDIDEDWIKYSRLKTGNFYAETSLKWTICHEMGHNLGLDHSYVWPPAIMFPNVVRGQAEDYLTRNDAGTLLSLYGRSNGWSVWPGRAQAEDLDYICVTPPYTHTGSVCDDLPTGRRQSYNQERATSTPLSSTTTVKTTTANPTTSTSPFANTNTQEQSTQSSKAGNKLYKPTSNQSTTKVTTESYLTTSTVATKAENTDLTRTTILNTKTSVTARTPVPNVIAQKFGLNLYPTSILDSPEQTTTDYFTSSTSTTSIPQDENEITSMQSEEENPQAGYNEQSSTGIVVVNNTPANQAEFWHFDSKSGTWVKHKQHSGNSQSF